MPEDSSQNTALSPEDSSLEMDTHVTAAAQAVDNATHAPTDNEIPQQMVETGPTGEDVDDSGTKTHAQKLSEYQARKAEMLSGKATEATPTAPNPPPVATPPAPQATNDEDEFPSAPTADGRMPKIKLQAVTPVDVQAMAEFKAHQRAGGKQSFVDFINTRFPAVPATAREVASGTDDGTTTHEATGQEPGTVAELDALLAQKKADRRAALKEFDFDRVNELEDEEETLRAKRDGLLQSESQQQNAAQQAWDAQETEYLTKVGKMFPQAKTASDPLVVRANELLNEWYGAQDQRASHPSRVMLCYVEAAAEFGIAPSAAAAPLKTPSTSSPVHRAPITAVIASGNANQTQTREQVETRTYEEKKAAFLAATAPQRAA
jgi:hypothetical protein